MPTQAKVLGNGTIRGKETLGLPWGLKPLHPSLSLSCWLMGVLRAVVEIPMLAVFHAR